nr:hypothetical protein CFP56_20400 [Quercus suber]
MRILEWRKPDDVGYGGDEVHRHLPPACMEFTNAAKRISSVAGYDLEATARTGTLGTAALCTATFSTTFTLSGPLFPLLWQLSLLLHQPLAVRVHSETVSALESGHEYMVDHLAKLMPVEQDVLCATNTSLRFSSVRRYLFAAYIPIHEIRRCSYM